MKVTGYSFRTVYLKFPYTRLTIPIDHLVNNNHVAFVRRFLWSCMRVGSDGNLRLSLSLLPKCAQWTTGRLGLELKPRVFKPRRVPRHHFEFPTFRLAGKRPDRAARSTPGAVNHNDIFDWQTRDLAVKNLPVFSYQRPFRRRNRVSSTCLCAHKITRT